MSHDESFMERPDLGPELFLSVAKSALPRHYDRSIIGALEHLPYA
jgi:hypothetical protein